MPHPFRLSLRGAESLDATKQSTHRIAQENALHRLGLLRIPKGTARSCLTALLAMTSEDKVH